MNKKTHFGFSEIAWEQKAKKVREVFEHVAPRYDVMNDVMSLGLHRLWKKMAVTLADAKPGDVVLDLAAGTGDLAKKLVHAVGPSGRVVLCDINLPMLEKGRERLDNAGILKGVEYVGADAENLPFAENYFDLITISFGLRNVRDQARALLEMHRVLKLGGKILILEFSRAEPAVAGLYDAYSFKVLPKLGKFIAHDEAAYQYLAESIRQHPDQESLKQLMEQAGFSEVNFYNLCFGVVAIHKAYKLEEAACY